MNNEVVSEFIFLQNNFDCFNSNRIHPKQDLVAVWPWKLLFSRVGAGIRVELKMKLELELCLTMSFWKFFLHFWKIFFKYDFIPSTFKNYQNHPTTNLPTNIQPNVEKIIYMSSIDKIINNKLIIMIVILLKFE